MPENKAQDDLLHLITKCSICPLDAHFGDGQNWGLCDYHMYQWRKFWCRVAGPIQASYKGSVFAAYVGPIKKFLGGA